MKTMNRNWIVVVGVHNGEPTYLGTLNVNANVHDGAAVKEHNRCGVARTENALRFSERGAKRLAKGYAGGQALEVT